jgi:AraC family transcriptional regulator of adaptative response / DNA-3-methyladenine glycosylase II
LARWLGMTRFGAVVTTGIYCRPGCGASPLPKNQLSFPSAAAAEAAGYRACLRCRPYRTASSYTWTGPEVVCRAVQLVLDGALDDGTEEDLAVRVGVSGRHLRRLFAEHLGVTPDGLARSARAHFARRLLDDTDLTVAEIAFAAGFGSIRQFNRVCRNVFHFNPGELRDRRRAKDRLVADGGLVLRLPYAGCLDYPAMLEQLAATAIPGVEVVDGRIYRRTVEIAGHPAVLEFAPGGEDHVLLTVHLPYWRDLLHTVARARRIMSLDDDPALGAAALADDPVIAESIRARPGVRPAGTWDPYEYGVRAVLAQDTPPGGVNERLVALVRTHGTEVPGLAALGLTHLFPPSTVLACGVDPGTVGNPRVGDIIVAFASACADRRLLLDHSLTLDQLVRAITAIEGIGESTAHDISMRLGEPDAFPIDDLGIRRYLESRPEAAMPAPSTITGRHWAGHRSLAATHLRLVSAASPRIPVSAGSAP